MTIAPTATKPPAVQSDDREVQKIADFLWAKHKDDTQVYRLPQRMEDIASLAPLAMTVSDPPTRAQVQAIADRLDAIVAAAQRTATT
jgi:hypothetical protein